MFANLNQDFKLRSCELSAPSFVIQKSSHWDEMNALAKKAMSTLDYQALREILRLSATIENYAFDGGNWRQGEELGTSLGGDYRNFACSSLCELLPLPTQKRQLYALGIASPSQLLVGGDDELHLISKPPRAHCLNGAKCVLSSTSMTRMC